MKRKRKRNTLCKNGKRRILKSGRKFLRKNTSKSRAAVPMDESLLRWSSDRLYSSWMNIKEQYQALIDKRVEIYDTYGTVVLRRFIRDYEKDLEWKLYSRSEQLRRVLYKRLTIWEKDGIM